MIAALFDADGTLYSAQYGRGMMNYARRHGRGLIADLYYASMIPPVVRMKLGFTDSEPVDRASIARLAWMVRGYDEAQAAAAFTWLADSYLLPSRRPHVVARLKEHLQQGHFVAILSGAFTTGLTVFAQRLGVSELVGTRLETRDGHYTGRIVPPIIKGADKAAHATRLLADHQPAIDWKASYAYGDSFSDRAMLELVGHPVAVHPDDRLRQLAQEKGWEVLEAG